jgi:hypothetical protein
MLLGKRHCLILELAGDAGAALEWLWKGHAMP